VTVTDKLISVTTTATAVTSIGGRYVRNGNDVVATPDAVYEPLDSYYRFTLDAAALPCNARCPRYWTPEDDALTRDWYGRVWLNPPYSAIAPWVAKSVGQVHAGNADLVAMLVPSRTGTRWYRDAVRNGAHVLHWPRRIRFTGDPAPWDSSVLVFGDARRANALVCQHCHGVFISRRDAVTCSARCRKSRSRERLLCRSAASPSRHARRAFTSSITTNRAISALTTRVPAGRPLL
jgi:phage N-6-adenine-methyltransferase